MWMIPVCIVVFVFLSFINIFVCYMLRPLGTSERHLNVVAPYVLYATNTCLNYQHPTRRRITSSLRRPSLHFLLPNTSLRLMVVLFWRTCCGGTQRMAAYFPVFNKQPTKHPVWKTPQVNKYQTWAVCRGWHTNTYSVGLLAPAVPFAVPVTGTSPTPQILPQIARFPYKTKKPAEKCSAHFFQFFSGVMWLRNIKLANLTSFNDLLKNSPLTKNKKNYDIITLRNTKNVLQPLLLCSSTTHSATVLLRMRVRHVLRCPRMRLRWQLLCVSQLQTQLQTIGRTARYHLTQRARHTSRVLLHLVIKKVRKGQNGDAET